MATGSTYSNLTSGLKRRYDDRFKGKVGWSKGPLAAMLAKKAWSGEFIPYPITVGNSPAVSATYSVAASKSEDSTYGYTRVKQAQVPWIKNYGRATIEGLLLRTAGDKMGTFYDKFVSQIDGIMDGVMNRFSTHVYRDGFGCIGNISSDTVLTTTTLKLAKKEDIVLFEVGMGIVFSSANSTATLRDSGEVLIVTAIQHNAGTMTVSAQIDTIASIAVGDFIFPEGDRQNSATPTRLALMGMDAWGPVAAPAGGENFNNLGDRNNDNRLLFNVVDTTTGTYAGANEEEALIIGATEADRFGGKPRAAFFNPTRYSNLLKLGQQRFRPTRIDGPYGIGFDGVVVETNYGNIRVFSDRYCPVKRAYLLDMDTWQVYGAGSSTIPDFLDHDGNKILRQTADDGVEARVGYYANMGTNAPCNNVVVKFET